MIRRRIVIEWDDDGTDTDLECLKQFCAEEFGPRDLFQIECNCIVRVENAIKQPKEGAVRFANGEMVESAYITG